MDIQTSNYREEYLSKMSVYDSLGKNLCESLELILEENKIEYLKIYYRIKDVDSFIEKIERKQYKEPFIQTEDICGIRIICYFQKDVEKINEILNKELEIKSSEDKEDILELNQFGYRSYHLIAGIPSTWFSTPNFRNLDGLIAEIQIRTVLMHAWAEIEHKLSYKKKSHIPDQIKRKLYRLSAKLEEADEQFQEIKELSSKFQNNIIIKARNKELSFANLKNIDLDTLQAFLDFRFPSRIRKIENTRSFLDELYARNVSINDLEEGYQKVKPFLSEIESNIFNKLPGKQWHQVGIARYILDLTNGNFRKRHGEKSVNLRDIEYWRMKLKI